MRCYAELLYATPHLYGDSGYRVTLDKMARYAIGVDAIVTPCYAYCYAIDYYAAVSPCRETLRCYAY